MRDVECRDTIAAIATSMGEGGIAIVRISGEKAEEILRAAFVPAGRKRAFPHAQMTYGFVKDETGETVDEAMAVLFRAPRSYTREDVAEIHCHGGRMCAASVMDILLRNGARAAEPGEFTYRAFINGRVDLSEAEAVMSLIGARSQAARRVSVRQLKGGVSSRIGASREALIKLLALIDAATDFPDEIDTPAASEEVMETAGRIAEELKRAADARAARLLREGASVVIAGRPNVGKSSLMNALLSAERAIVTDIPGTTRDVLTESVEIGGVRFSLSDTAGIRETGDVVEKIGVERARDALRNADCVLLVLSADTPETEEDKALLAEADERYVIAVNKCDLVPGRKNDDAAVRGFASVNGENPGQADGSDHSPKRFYVSARTGEGIPQLTEAIRSAAGAAAASEDMMTLPRHIECATRAAMALTRACESIAMGTPLDFAAADIREALEALGDITGETMNEQVIDRVFADFCVGK